MQKCIICRPTVSLCLSGYNSVFTVKLSSVWPLFSPVDWLTEAGAAIHSVTVIVTAADALTVHIFTATAPGRVFPASSCVFYSGVFTPPSLNTKHTRHTRRCDGRRVMWSLLPPLLSSAQFTACNPQGEAESLITAPG